MLGKIGGFIIGIVAGLAAMVAIAYVGGNFFPAPPAATGDLAEQAASALAAAPLGFKLVIVLCWFLGSLIGAWLAKLVSGSGGVAWAVTIVLALLILANIFVAAFPTWMAIAAVAGPLIGGTIGNGLARPSAPALPEDAASTTEA
jgi:hypothetical protein